MALSAAATGLQASYPAQPPQVATIRRAVSTIAKRGGADTETLIRLELAISEAATNVVLHAYRAPGLGGDIHVTACIVRGSLDITVRDDGCGMAPRPDSPGMGLGLSLMASESDRFEVRSVEGGGTEVQLGFKLPPRSEPGCAESHPARRARARAGERASV